MIYLSLLVVFFLSVYNPIWGLSLYLIFDGIIYLGELNNPFGGLVGQLARFNQVITFSVFIHCIFLKNVSFKLTREGWGLIISLMFFLLVAISTYNLGNHMLQDEVYTQLLRLFKMIFLSLVILFAVDDIYKFKNLIIVMVFVGFFQALIMNFIFIKSFNIIEYPVNLVSLSFSLIMVLNSKSSWLRIIFLFCLIIVVSSVVLTNSRRFFLGMFICLFSVLYVYRSKNVFFKFIGVFSVITITGFLISRLLIFQLDNVGILTRIDQTMKLADTDDTRAWSNRNYLWPAAWLMITERPLVGHGYGASSNIMPDYISDVGGGYDSGNRMRAHNLYLKAWSDMGILGLISLLLIMFFIAKIYFNSINLLSRNNYLVINYLLICLFINIVAYYTMAIFGWSGYMDKPFWVQYGIALSLSNIIGKKAYYH